MKDRMIFVIFLVCAASAWVSYRFSEMIMFGVPVFFLMCAFVMKAVFKRKIGTFCVLAVCCVGAMAATLEALDTTKFVLSNYNSKLCRIYADVGEMQSENDYFDVYEIKVRKVTNPYGENERIADEKAYLYIKEPNENKLKYGDCICTLVEVEEVKSANNRGEVDYSRVNKANGIFYTVSAKCADIKIYRHNDEIKNIYDAAHGLREYIKGVFSENLDEKSAATARAIFISDKNSLDDETKTWLSDAGIAHINSASGLHVNCIVCMVAMIAGMVGIKRKYAKMIAIPILLVYVFINNCTPSMIRASVMFAVNVLSGYVKRDEDKLISCAVAGLVILAINPLAVFDVGFIMSFACVICINLFFERIMEFFRRVVLDKLRNRGAVRKLAYYICSTAAVTIAAQIASIPICICFFEKINPYSMLANLIVSWCLPWLMFGCVLMPIFGFFGVMQAVCGFAVKWLCVYVLATAKFVSGLAFANVECFVSAVFPIVYVLGTVAVCKLLKRKTKSACLMAGLCVIIISVNIIGNVNEGPCVNFVNVGQADGCFVKTGLHSAIVVDAGGKNNTDKDNVFTPYMKRCGVRKIEYVFVSHFDTDHAKNVLCLIDNFKIDNIVFPYRSEKAKIPLRDEIAAKAENYGIKIIYAADSDVFEIGNGIKAYVYAPPKNLRYFESENEGSLAVKLCVNDKNILFLGDLDKEIQEAMAYKYGHELECDVLKVAHHGSFKSYSPEVISFAKPKVAVISCGDKNIYSHPDEETVLDLEKRNICVLTTAEYKDIRFCSYNNNLIYSCGNERGES